MGPEQLVVRLEAAEEATQQLVAHLHSMLNHPHFSDMCFVCSDGVKVYASRFFLMARSPVLHRMLSNGMVESCMSEISLPEITSSTLLPTIEFLYTGAVTKHAMDFETSLLVLHAASFFHIPTLEHQLKAALVSSFNNDIFPLDDVSAETVAQHLTSILSCGISELLNVAVFRILACLCSNCWGACPTTFLRHLSAEAMQMLLDHMRPILPNVPSFMEYIRLRSLLLWGACHVSSMAEVLLLSALPNEDMLAPHIDALKSSGESYLEVMFQRKGLTTSEQRHLKNIHLFLSAAPMPDIDVLLRIKRIHPVIQLSILKPIICGTEPAPLSRSWMALHSQLEDAFHTHVAHLGEMSAIKWVCFGEVAGYYEVQENGALLVAKSPHSNSVFKLFDKLAVVDISFRKPSGVYETIFTVVRMAKELCFVLGRSGIYKDPPGGVPPYGRWLVGTSLIVADNGRKVLLISSEGSGRFCDTSICLKEGDQVRAIMDMSKRCCTFCIGGHEILVGENLLGDLVLLAGCSPGGKLRVEVVSEITFL